MDFYFGSELSNLVSKLSVTSQHECTGFVAKYVLVFVDEVVVEVTNVGLLGTSLGGGEYFVSLFVA